MMLEAEPDGRNAKSKNGGNEVLFRQQFDVRNEL